MLTILLALGLVGDTRVIANETTPPQIVSIAPSPTPVVRTTAPPPQPVIAGPAEAAQVRIRVTAGGKLLLDDEFRVSRGAGASYNENRGEAPLINCSADRYYGSSERHSLSAQLNLRDEPQTGPAVFVSITWQRPTSSTVCPNEGTRSVSVSQTVPLAPGQTSSVQGDGGLVVTLTRR